MLAWERQATGWNRPQFILEFGYCCHYHSALATGRCPAYAPGPVEMLVNTKTRIVAAVLVLYGATTTFVHPAFAEGNAEAGEAIGYSCLGCHGIEGYRNAYPSYRVPKLGGQQAGYLVIALQGYRNGTRKHPTMNAQAISLTDQQIEDVAAYLASMNNETVEAGGSEGRSFETATTCVACHGQNGIGLSPAWPTLAGQHEDYLVHSLKQYRNGERSDAIMGGFAAQLSDADINLLAQYYAALDGLETTVKD